MNRIASVALAVAALGFCAASTANVCEGTTSGVTRSAQMVAWAAGDEVASSASHLLGTSPSEMLSLNAVLLRRQLGTCGPADEYAGYVPKTQHDNTPWRFNADSGRGLSAAEFDAWMKSRGVRVARGRGEAAPAEEAAVVTQ